MSSVLADQTRVAALTAYGVLDTGSEAALDSLVQLAAQFCDAPVALVTLVDDARQFFKAREGYEGAASAPLEVGFCPIVVERGEPVVIPDTHADAAHAMNPAAGEGGVRFYAGVPLRTEDGHTLGTLCVLDRAPRPQGLPPAQIKLLQALATQVVSQFELRRALAEQQAVIRERDALARVQAAIAAAGGESDTILAALVAAALEAVPAAEGGALELVDSEWLEYRAVGGTLGEYRGLRVPLHGSTSGACAITNSPILLTDTRTDPRVARDLGARLNQRAALFAPVSRGDAVLGVLKLQSSRPGAFTPRDLQLVRLFAGAATAGLTEVWAAQAQRAVAAGAQRQRAIFDSITDFAIVVTDCDGLVTEWNMGAEHVLGWSAEEMREHTVERIFTPEDRAADRAGVEMREALANGRANDERWHLRADGGRFWASGEMMPLRDAGGGHIGFVKVLRDRTEQRQAGERLAESEARLKQAQEAGGVGLFTVDIATNILTPTPEFCRLYGLPVRAQCSAAEVEAQIIPEDRQLVSTGLSRSRGEAQREVEYRVRLPKTGALRWIARTGEIHFDQEGRPQRFMGTARDITAAKLAAQRQAALMSFGDRLRDATTSAEAVGLAAELLGRTLNASRAGCARIDARGREFEIERDWTALGVASLAGRHALGIFPTSVDCLRRGDTIVVANLPAAGWLAADAESYRAIGARAQIKVPFLEHGGLVGFLYVHQEQPRAWAGEEIDFAHSVADRTYAALAKLRAEADQRVLNEEISHRLKNTLAMVLSIAGQTLRSVPDRAPVEAFERRIQALSQAHDVLLRQSWAAAPAKEVARAVLAGTGHGDRIEVSGPEVNLGPRATLSLSLLLHELATNAVKYGALSVPSGRVAVDWQLAGEGEGREVTLDWTEQGGPPPSPPASTGRQGFGSRLIGMGLVGTGGVDLRYPASGFEATMRAPLAQLQQS